MSAQGDGGGAPRRRVRPRPGQVVWWVAGMVLVAAAVALVLVS